MENINKQKLILAIALIALGVIGRIGLHDFFNGIINPIPTNGFPVPLDVFFVVATVSIFSGLLLGKYYAILVPMCVIVITDVTYAIIDPKTASVWASSIFLFTWSGYTIIALIGSFAKRKEGIKITFIPKLLGAGALGVIFYDLWTNFGFWLGFSKLGFYPQTLGGLATVYVGGIPSMIWHLISVTVALTIVAVPLIYLREHELLKKTIALKPMEKYIIASATLILMSASILITIF